MPITSVAGVSDAGKSLKTLMDAVLERLQDRFDYHNVTLPAKKYWKVGAPVIDCEQLVLSVAQLYIGPPGNPVPQPMRCNSPRSVVFRAMIAREIPIVDGRGHEPAAAIQQAASEVSAVDAWVLLDAVAHLDGWDVVDAFGMGVVANIDVEEPQGGLQVVTATFAMAIP